MNLAALALLAALQGLAPAPAPDAPPALDAAQAGEPVPEVPAALEPEPWPGSLAEGLAEVRAALEAKSREDVLALAARVGLAARSSTVEPARAARVLHDLGLARVAVDDLEGGLGELRSAAGAAGPGAVRESALYAAGTARLLRAEALRQAVPEIAKSLGLPEPPASEEQGGPDALDVARAAYMAARGELLERLRVDARHADTRANLELVTRRLRELDSIQREREEQEQEQEQEQQDPNQQQQPQDQEQPQDPQEQDPQDEPQDPQEQDPQESEQQQQQEQEPPEPQESEQEPGEEESEPEPQEAPQGELEERVLSKEEVQRLLDQLEEIEEEAQAVRARLRERRRKPVDKDW